MMSDPVVVLGFGAASVSAVIALREVGYEGRLIVVTDEGSEPYSPVLTSYYAGGRIERCQCFAWADLDVSSLVDELVTHAHIESLDPSAHAVKLADGRHIQYSKLLIATGAHPIAPGFPHVDGYEPLVLRTLHDAECLRAALERESCRSVLVSGTSMVGLKALEACLDQGVCVTLLGRSSHIMRGVAHPAIARHFEELLVERGVALRLSQTVDKVEVVQTARDISSTPDDAGVSMSCTITFSNGDAEQFDEVILAQGVRPNLDFVAACNLALDIDRGLAVDRFMRTDLPDVYAAGDVARALDLQTGERRIIGLWQNAVQQGRCAGRAISAELAGFAPVYPFPGSIPANTIHVRDVLFASAGSMDGGSYADGEDVRFAVCESHDTMRMLAYRTVGCSEQLVGFNILSVLSERDRHDELNCEIGKYRREILNSLL